MDQCIDRDSSPTSLDLQRMLPSLSREERQYLNEHWVRITSTLSLARQLWNPGTQVVNIGLSPVDMVFAQVFGHDNYSTLIPPTLRRTLQTDRSYSRLRFIDCDLALVGSPIEPVASLVIMAEVLEHVLGEDETIVSNVSKLLFPSGRVILTVPNAARHSNRLRLMLGKNVYSTKQGILHGAFGGYGHIREYTQDEVTELLSFSFRRVRVRGLNPYGSRLQRRLLNLLPRSLASVLVFDAIKKPAHDAEAALQNE